jgi:hypothetical protein
VAPVLLFFFLVRGIHALPDKEAHHVEPVWRTDVNVWSRLLRGGDAYMSIMPW